MKTLVRSVIGVGIGLVVGFGAGFFTGRGWTADVPTQAAPAKQLAESPVTTGGEHPVESPELREARARLAEMRASYHYTDEFPPVKMLMSRIRELEAQQRAR